MRNLTELLRVQCSLRGDAEEGTDRVVIAFHSGVAVYTVSEGGSLQRASTEGKVGGCGAISPSPRPRVPVRTQLHWSARMDAAEPDLARARWGWASYLTELGGLVCVSREGHIVTVDGETGAVELVGQVEEVRSQYCNPSSRNAVRLASSVPHAASVRARACSRPRGRRTRSFSRWSPARRRCSS